MIRVVTFDAANTIIRHEWDGAKILLDSALEIGIAAPDQADARAAYAKIAASTRNEHEEIELRRDPQEIRAFWQRFTAAWLASIGQDESQAKQLHQAAEAKVFSPSGMVWSLFGDVIPTLDALDSLGMRVGVISNWDSSLHRILETHGISQRLDFVIASLEHGIEKPDKRIFQISEQVGSFGPNEALHVGDSYEDDVVGAKSAGWRALLLDRSSPSSRHNGRISSLLELLEEVTLCA